MRPAGAGDSGGVYAAGHLRQGPHPGRPGPSQQATHAYNAASAGQGLTPHAGYVRTGDPQHVPGVHVVQAQTHASAAHGAHGSVASSSTQMQVYEMAANAVWPNNDVLSICRRQTARYLAGCMGGPLGPHSMACSHLAAVLHTVAEPAWSALQGPLLSKFQQLCQGDPRLQMLQPASHLAGPPPEPVVMLDVAALTRSVPASGSGGSSASAHTGSSLQRTGSSGASAMTHNWQQQQQQQAQAQVQAQQAAQAHQQQQQQAAAQKAMLVQHQQAAWQQAQQQAQQQTAAAVQSTTAQATVQAAGSAAASAAPTAQPNQPTPPMSYLGPMVPALHVQHGASASHPSRSAQLQSHYGSSAAGSVGVAAGSDGMSSAGADASSSQVRHRFPPGYTPDVLRLRILAHAVYCSSSAGAKAGEGTGGSKDAENEALIALRRLSACYLAGCVRGPLGPHSLKGSLLGEVLMRAAPQTWARLEQGASRLRQLQDGCLQVVPRAGNLVVRLEIDVLEARAHQVATAVMPLPPWFTSKHVAAAILGAPAAAEADSKGLLQGSTEHASEQRPGSGSAMLSVDNSHATQAPAQPLASTSVGADARATITASSPAPTSAAPKAEAPVAGGYDGTSGWGALAESAFPGTDPASTLRRVAVTHILSVPRPPQATGNTSRVYSMRASELAHVFRVAAPDAWAALPVPTGTSKIAVLFASVQGLWIDDTDPTAILVGVDVHGLRRVALTQPLHTPQQAAVNAYTNARARDMARVLHGGAESRPNSDESGNGVKAGSGVVRPPSGGYGPPTPPSRDVTANAAGAPAPATGPATPQLHQNVQAALAGVLQAHAAIQGAHAPGASTVLVRTGSGTHAMVQAPAELAATQTLGHTPLGPQAAAAGAQRTVLPATELQALGRVAFGDRNVASVLRLAAVNQLSLLQGTSSPLGPLAAPLPALATMLRRLHPVEMGLADQTAAQAGVPAAVAAMQSGKAGAAGHAGLEAVLLGVPCFARTAGSTPAQEPCVRLLATELLLWAAHVASAALPQSVTAAATQQGTQGTLTQASASALIHALQQHHHHHQQQQQPQQAQQVGSHASNAAAAAKDVVAKMHAVVMQTAGGQAHRDTQQQAGADGQPGNGKARADMIDDEGLALCAACVAIWWPHNPPMLAAALGIVGQGPYWAQRNGGRHRLPADIVRTAVASALRRTGADTGANSHLSRHAADAAVRDVLSADPLLTLDAAGCMVLPIHKLADAALTRIEGSRSNSSGSGEAPPAWPPNVEGLAACTYLPRQAHVLARALAELIEGPSQDIDSLEAMPPLGMPRGAARDALLARCLAMLRSWARGSALPSATSSTGTNTSTLGKPVSLGGAAGMPSSPSGSGASSSLTWQQQELVRQESWSSGGPASSLDVRTAGSGGPTAAMDLRAWRDLNSATGSIGADGAAGWGHHGATAGAATLGRRPLTGGRPDQREEALVPGGAGHHGLDDAMHELALTQQEEDEEGLALCAAAMAVWWPVSWPLCAAAVAIFCQSPWAVHHNGGRHRAQLVFVLREMSACQARPGAPMQRAPHMPAKPLLHTEPLMKVMSGGVPPAGQPVTGDATQVVEVRVVELAAAVVAAAGTGVGTHINGRGVVWPPPVDSLVVSTLHHLSHPLISRFMARMARGGSVRATILARALAVLQRIAAAGTYPLPGTQLLSHGSRDRAEHPPGGVDVHPPAAARWTPNSSGAVYGQAHLGSARPGSREGGPGSWGGHTSTRRASDRSHYAYHPGSGSAMSHDTHEGPVSGGLGSGGLDSDGGGGQYRDGAPEHWGAAETDDEHDHHHQHHHHPYNMHANQAGTQRPHDGQYQGGAQEFEEEEEEERDDEEVERQGGAGVAEEGVEEGGVAQEETAPAATVSWQTIQESFVVAPGFKWADIDDDDEGDAMFGHSGGSGLDPTAAAAVRAAAEADAAAAMAEHEAEEARARAAAGASSAADALDADAMAAELHAASVAAAGLDIAVVLPPVGDSPATGMDHDLTSLTMSAIPGATSVHGDAPPAPGSSFSGATAVIEVGHGQGLELGHGLALGLAGQEEEGSFYSGSHGAASHASHGQPAHMHSGGMEEHEEFVDAEGEEEGGEGCEAGGASAR